MKSYLLVFDTEVNRFVHLLVTWVFTLIKAQGSLKHATLSGWVTFFLVFCVSVIDLQDLFAQTSPTRQATFVVPTTLSSCNKDTICILVSNMQGGKGITYAGNVTLDIDIPGGALIPYVSGSVKSFPAGATEVSYAANKLKISVPLPATGATTRVCFVVIPECSISTISGLPSFAGKITYPVGFPTAAETFKSSLINVGAPKLTLATFKYFYGGGFGGKTQLGYDIVNSGYGNIDEVTLYTIVPNALVLDSIKISSSPNYKDVYLTPTATMPIITPYDATHSLHTYKLKGVDLGSDGILEVGGHTFLEEHFNAPAVCATYDFISWPDYTCKSGTQTACTPPVKIPSKIEVAAGTPKLDGTLISAESPDGCPNKHIEYKVKNNGVGNAAPVGNAYDVDLNINFGSGLLSLINLKLNGVAVPAANITPTTGSNNSSFTIKLKDLMTTDPDGAGGISDIDGDGFFDDMLVGAETTVSFDYNIPCNLVCGANILYDVNSTATFTDFCRTLKGVTSTPLIKFGFRQEQPIEQANTPNYGTLTTGQSVAKNVRYNFKYQQFNMDFTNAVAEIRINYSKQFEIDLGSLKLNGVSVTGTKIGTDTQASTSATDPAQTATSNDSTIVITLTPAQVAELFDANGDSLSYTQIFYGCDIRQNTTSADNWQLIMKMKSGLCSDGSTPCGFDLACKKPYVYGQGNTCGVFQPCLIGTADLKRIAPTGYNNVAKTIPQLTDPGRLYAGDTLQYSLGSFIQYDYPLGKNGTWLNAYGVGNPSGDLLHQFTFNYSVPTGYQGESPFLFQEGGSKIVVRQRTPDPSNVNLIGTLGAVLFEAPLLLKDFYTGSNPATINNNDSFAGYPLPAAWGTSTENCALYPTEWWAVNCPLENFGYYPAAGNIISFRQFNIPRDKVTDSYSLMSGQALARAGWFGELGDDNYYIEVQSNWKVNPKFPWDNTNSFSTKAYIAHYGNGNTSYAGTCNRPAASALAVTKDYYIPDPRATYKPECSLRISNKIDFKSYSGNYFQNGEVRVPFTVDKIVATIPSEYAFAAVPNITLEYNQSCSAQTTTAITASATSGTVTFTNTAGGDFPRVDDCAGLTTAYNLSYTLAKVGTAAPSNYKMPIQIFTKDEWGAVVILYDTLTIAEANPVLTLTPVTSVVKIDDGGTCGTSYVDYVIQNNTLFAAPNTYFAVKSSANTIVTDLTDGGNVYGDPIVAGDIATYGTNDKIVKLGTLGAGDIRTVRIFFQTSVCADQLDVYTDFGCSYPSPLAPNLASLTLKTAKLDFSATDPVIISRPNAAVTVANLCDNKTLYIQVSNTTNANIYKMLAGLKFPAGISYVAGTAQLYNSSTGGWNNVPAADITSPSTDSLAINLANTAPFNTACGSEGPDKTNGLAWIKFDIEFTACPPANVASILYKVQAENFCGTKTNSMGVFPVNFVGTGSQNNYTLSSKADPIKLCAATGVALPVTDKLYIKNIGGYGTASGASSGKDSVTITLQFNPAEFTLTALTIGAPFSSPVFGTDTQGKPTVRLLIPAGIAVGDSLAMPLTYTITPLKDKLCTVASTPPLCFFGLFSSPFLLECAAKNLSCAAGGVALRGSGLSLRAFECCFGSIGDYVWKDTNKDGKQDVGEIGVNGIKVILWSANGTGTPVAKLDSTVTANGGKYLFDTLTKGDYVVQFVKSSIPAECSGFTAKDSTATGTTDANDSDADKITGITAKVSLDPVVLDATSSAADSLKTNNFTIDAGLIALFGSLGDFVWKDTNNNGIQDETTPNAGGVAGVQIELYKNGTFFAKDTTDVTGHYLFTNLAAGTYKIKVLSASIPAGCEISSVKDAPNDDAKDSDVDKTTGESGNYVIDPNDPTKKDILTVDAGLFTPCTKPNAGPDATAVCQPITTAKLTAVTAGGTWVPIGSPANPAAATIDANGNIIGMTVAGTYKFVYSVTSGNQICSDTAQVTVNAKPTITDGTATICAGETVDLTTKITNYATLLSRVWTIATASGTSVTTPASVKPTTTTTYVLVAQNAAGCKDTATVVVTVNPKPDAGTDQTLACANAQTNTLTTATTLVPATTGGTFTQIGTTPAVAAIAGNAVSGMTVAGTYQFQYNVLGCLDTVAVTVQPCAGCVKPNAGSDVTLTCPPSGIAPTTTMLTPVTSGGTWAAQAGNPAASAVTGNSVTGLTIAGTYKFIYSVTSGGQTCTDTVQVIVPTCVQPKGSLGDFVWKDTNNNGIQDETTPNGGGVAGVQIELYKNGTLFAKDTTDATGKYLFSNLEAGTYKIKVLSASIPAGCEISSVKDAPNDDAKDSDVDKTTGESGNYVIDPLDPTKKDIVTVDAALYSPKGSLGDFVWKDTNNNGIQDETTPNGGGVAGVQVELYKNGTLFAKDTTDATGKYLFTNLDAGTYKIKVLSASIPAGCEISSVKDAPNDDTKDSDVDKTTGESGNYVIDPLDPTKKDILIVDAALYSPKGSLGDFVWKDTNNNGIQDETTPNGGGVAGVQIELYKNGTFFAKDTTDAQGKYLFTNLEAGTYKIKVLSASITAGCEISSVKDAPSDDTKDSDVDKTTGESGNYEINPLDPTKKDILTVDAALYSPKGSLGDFVWKDTNNNGIQDETTPNGGGVAGVQIELYKNGTLFAKDTTDATGKYLFTNLEAGTYKIKVLSASLPAGCEISSVKDAPSDDAKDSDVDKTTGESGNYVIDPTDPTKKDILTVDAALYSPKGSLGDFVWKDANNNGIQDETTPNGGGVAKVQIELYKNGTLFATDTTDTQGKYLFTNLEAGTYKIKVLSASIPAGCEISSVKDAPNDDAKDSDVDKTTGESGNYVIDPLDPTKKDILTVDAGLVVPCLKSKVTLTGAPVCSADIQTYSITFSVTGKNGFIKVNKGTLRGANPYTVTGIPSGAIIKITDSLSAVCKFDTLITGPNCNCNPALPMLLTPSMTACAADTFPTIKATVVGLATVEWFTQATGGTAVFTGLNYKPSGTVPTTGAVFYAQARSTDPTCPTAISTSRVAATINAQDCTKEVDLALKKSINTKIAQIGDVLTYTLKVWNESNTNATGVEVTDSIATTVQFVAGSFIASRGSASINDNVIKWNIGNIAANGDTVTLTYRVKAAQEGVHFNTAEICKTNEKDVDSTPCNHKDDEDDIDRQCFTVPVKLCAGEKVQASVPSTYTNVQWFKDGSNTPIASGNVVMLTDVGVYTYTASNQTCPAGGCCPIIIEAGTNCCPTQVCVPFTVKKKRK